MVFTVKSLWFNGPDQENAGDGLQSNTQG